MNERVRVVRGDPYPEPRNQAIEILRKIVNAKCDDTTGNDYIDLAPGVSTIDINVSLTESEAEFLKALREPR
jgi:hypothetical protein